MGEPFGLVVRFDLKPGHEQAFDALVSDTLPGIKDREPETLIYTCHTVADRPSQRVFYELYRDRAAFDEHEEQPHVKHFLSEREEHVESFEVAFLALIDGKGSGTPL